jgi:23S rRNA pseudouridine1911/1915/1917 synthase
VGDATYGAAAIAARAPEAFRGILTSFPRPALHAQVLGFVHPLSGKDMRFEAPWPEDLERLRRDLQEAGASGRRGSRS